MIVEFTVDKGRICINLRDKMLKDDVNLVFKCEQCGIKRPCIIVMVDSDTVLEPRICVNGGTADWKSLL